MKKMKYIFSYLIVATLLLSSCGKDFLDVDPTATVTFDQMVEEVNKNPDNLRPITMGTYALLVAFNTLDRAVDTERHSDFGHASVTLSSDLMTDDMVQTSAAYGWYYTWYDFSERTEIDNDDVRLPWQLYYKVIYSANNALNIIDNLHADVKEDPSVIANRGQSYAMRAFAYYNLMTLYANPYKGHETDPGVPIVTEKTTTEQVLNNPRAEVQKVYALMLDDLTNAEEDLQSYSRYTKTEIDIQVVYGLLARVHLAMENWDKAAEYANMARQGFPLMQKGELYWQPTSMRSFIDIDNDEWMWGSDINEFTEIATTGIVNFISHMSSVSYGYATAGGMYKAIDARLYSQIPRTDARRNQFLEETSEVNGRVVTQYANLKFGRYNRAGYNFGDQVLMRAAEMYLIEAEALSMIPGREADAQQVLYDFVSQRDPGYVKSTKTGQELREEVYFQRRIELWGEGFSYFDHKRLNKGINRSYEGSNHPVDAQVDFAPGANEFKFRIPNGEILYNKGISPSDNNP